MSRPLQIDISDHLFALLARQAADEGTQPEALAQRAVEKEYATRRLPSDAEQQAAGDLFERHIGTWDVGRPIASDNEQIDANLVAEYGRGFAEH
ncbi:MAG: hypothetical protein WD872_18230 [Pirellulaceae bacterium]